MATRWAGRGGRAAFIATAGWLAAAGRALAESPMPSQDVIGDPRSSGQGPGFAGDPVLAIAAVALIALATLAVTLAWVRLTAGPRDPGQEA